VLLFELNLTKGGVMQNVNITEEEIPQCVGQTKDNDMLGLTQDSFEEMSRGLEVGPSREASPRCESGGYNFCTCSICF
jgi:hypothetical protein